MSKNKIIAHQEYSLPASTTLETQTVSTDSLKEGLGFLLSRYLESQSGVVAKKIVQQLEKLLHHSDCIGFPNDRCTYYKLLHYWRAKSL